jgi:methyl-accepting chemotaxis protein
MLNKIKIGPKLIGGFLVVAIIAGVIGVLGITNMKKIDKDDTFLYEKCTVPLGDLDNVAVPVQRQRVDIEAAMRSNDPKFVEAKKTKIYDFWTTIENGVKHYETTLLNKQDSLSYVALKEDVSAWHSAVDNIWQLKSANKNALAYAYIDGEAFKVVSNLRAHVDSMVDENIDGAKETSDNNTKTANSATLQMIIVLAIGVVLAMIIGIFLTLSITRPVNAVVATARKIAEEDLAGLTEVLSASASGDLSKSVDIKTQELKVKSEDEIGILGRTFNQMIAKFQEAGKAVAQVKASLEQVSGETLMLAKAASEGQLATRGDVKKFKGTYREMVEGFNDTLDAVINPVNEAAAVLEKVANRDMSARVVGDYKGDLAKIKNSLNSAVTNLDQALEQVAQATEQVSSGSQQISAGSQSLAQGANEQASSLEEVSSSLEEMSSMTKQNAENANQAKTLAGEANNNAAQGTEAMGRMSSSINKIKESSDQTAKIVKTIDEIAIQTNLLALNAAVEAARAGEAGRGFAVVAEEVRNLAQRSSQAAKNTADMITESVKNAEDGVNIAQEVSKSFDAIAGSAKKVNDLIAEIAAASQEQSQGIDQVNTAVAQMDKVTQQNAANSEESASAAEEMSSQAEELQSMIGQFTLTNAARKDAVKSVVHHDIGKLAHAKTALEHKTDLHKKNGNGHNGGNGHHNKIDAKQAIPLEDEAALKSF